MKTAFVVRQLDGPERLDRVLRRRHPEWGRRTIASIVNGRQVRVNGRVVWLGSWKVRNGDRIEIASPPEPKPESPKAFDDAWVIRDEPDLLAVDKPAGLLSQATRWTDAPNLLDLAVERFGPLALFHRLDRDTSGVVLLTRAGPVNQYLDEAFKTRTVIKEYLAVVGTDGDLASEGTVSWRIDQHPQRRDMMVTVARGGRRAVTRYQILAKAGGRRWVRLWPETGRTHQLRVHLSALGAPIVGDRLYGPRPVPGERLLLHAQRIVLPGAPGWPQRVFEAPLPTDFPPPP